MPVHRDNIAEVVLNAWHDARRAVIEGSDRQDANRKRSAKWVTSLAKRFEEHYAGGRYRLFWSGNAANRRQFRRNEFLFDLAVCSVSAAKSLEKVPKNLEFIARCHWQIESEFSRDNTRDILDKCSKIAGRCTGRVYCCFVSPRTTGRPDLNASLSTNGPRASGRRWHSRRKPEPGTTPAHEARSAPRHARFCSVGRPARQLVLQFAGGADQVRHLFAASRAMHVVAQLRRHHVAVAEDPLHKRGEPVGPGIVESIPLDCRERCEAHELGGGKTALFGKGLVAFPLAVVETDRARRAFPRLAGLSLRRFALVPIHSMPPEIAVSCRLVSLQRLRRRFRRSGVAVPRLPRLRPIRLRPGPHPHCGPAAP